MPYVLTVDQRGSRSGVERVAGVLARLDALGQHGGFAPVLPFERTAGDEFQGLLAAASDVVLVVLDLVRDGGWSIGIGAGAVQTPLPNSVRAATGPAFVSARRAVVAATTSAERLAVRGNQPAEASDAQAVLRALAALVRRRSAAAWEAIALVEGGRTQAQAAEELGVSRQAVGQRLGAAAWEIERDLRVAVARLLDRAAG